MNLRTLEGMSTQMNVMPNISISEADPHDWSEWDHFVDKSVNGTLFHKLRFLSYHKNKYQWRHLLIRKGGQTIAAMPGGVEGKIFRSPMGASYGFFAHQDLDFSQMEEVIDSLLDYFKQNGVDTFEVTLAPSIYSNDFSETQKYLLEYKGFSLKGNLISHAVAIDSIKNENDAFLLLNSSQKRGVRKSCKVGVTTAISKDFESFYEMLLECKRKHRTAPVHTFDELVELSKLFPEDIHLMMAHNEEQQPIAGIVFFVCNPRCVLMFYIAHFEKYQSLRGVPRVVYEVMVWAASRKFRWIDMGVSMNTLSLNPLEPSRSLIAFKECFGSRGFLRPQYIWRASM